MDKLVIEYNSSHNKKIARALEKAAVAVLEQYHVDKVYMGHYTQYTPGKCLFTYVGEACGPRHPETEGMGYKEIVNALYMHLIHKPGFDLCGPKSHEAMREIGKFMEEYPALDRCDLDMLAAEGFAENAENGFYHGFQCAAALLTGAVQSIDTARASGDV